MNIEAKNNKSTKITTATAAPAPRFEIANACSYTLTVKVRVPALPPVKRKMSSNLLNVQIKRSRKSTARIPAMKGKDKNQNCCIGDAPSISAASYISEGIDCIRAKIKRNESGKYRHISNRITIVRASGKLKEKPKISIPTVL